MSLWLRLEWGLVKPSLPTTCFPGMLMGTMKTQVGAVILAVVCLGLAIVLIASRQHAEKQKTTDTQTIQTLSNNLVTTRGQLEDQTGVATGLREDFEKLKQQKQSVENSLGELTNKFTQVSATLADTKAALTASKEEVARRDARIGELETQNNVLDKRALDLTTSITNLNAQITETQRKLAASEGDKAMLEQELKRLRIEKAELERQFNDLTVLRAQVSRLKEELSVARRLELLRQGFFARSDERGAQRLMQGATASKAKPAPIPSDLNVEVSADGTVKIIPPLTNRPAGTSPSPK